MNTRPTLISDRTVWVLVGALLIVHAGLAALLFDPKPFTGGDNAGYMVLAESLESGLGYRDIYLPDAPRHGQYPPFYPVVLATARLLGGGLLTYKALSIVFTLCGVLLLFLVGKQRLGPAGGLAMTVPLAMSPVLLEYSHWVLSEAPFVAATVGALAAVQQYEESKSKRWLVLGTGAALIAYLTRAAGLPLLAALVIMTIWRWRRALVGVIPSVLVVVGGWWLWGRVMAPESGEIYGTNFLLINPYAPEMGYIGPGDLLTRVVNNIRLYSVEVLPQALAGRSAGGPVTLLALLTALTIVVLAFTGWLKSMARPRTLEWFTLLYGGLIFVWPEVWTDQRFLLPLLPVIFVYAGCGLSWCFDFVRRAQPAWVLPALGGLIALLSIPDHVRLIPDNQRCLRLYRQGDGLACYAPEWRSFFQAALWLRDNTPDDTRVVSRKPRLFYLVGRRVGNVYPFTSDTSEVLAFLDRMGADYVVVARLSATTYRYLVPAIRTASERFEIVHELGEPPAYIIRYLQQLGSAGRPGA